MDYCFLSRPDADSWLSMQKTDTFLIRFQQSPDRLLPVRQARRQLGRNQQAPDPQEPPCRQEIRQGLPAISLIYFPGNFSNLAFMHFVTRDFDADKQDRKKCYSCHVKLQDEVNLKRDNALKYFINNAVLCDMEGVTLRLLKNFDICDKGEFMKLTATNVTSQTTLQEDPNVKNNPNGCDSRGYKKAKCELFRVT